MGPEFHKQPEPKEESPEDNLKTTLLVIDNFIHELTREKEKDKKEVLKLCGALVIMLVNKKNLLATAGNTVEAERTQEVVTKLKTILADFPENEVNSKELIQKIKGVLIEL